MLKQQGTIAMPNAEQQRRLNQLLARLEKDVDASAQMHVVAASIAVSLKRIADHFERTGGVPLKRR